MLFSSSLQYPMNGEIGRNTTQQWWGNTVFKNTADWHATPLRRVPDGEHFGCVLPSHRSWLASEPASLSVGRILGRPVVVPLDVLVAVICYRIPPLPVMRGVLPCTICFFCLTFVQTLLGKLTKTPFPTLKRLRSRVPVSGSNNSARCAQL